MCVCLCFHLRSYRGGLYSNIRISGTVCAMHVCVCPLTQLYCARALRNCTRRRRRAMFPMGFSQSTHAHTRTLTYNAHTHTRTRTHTRKQKKYAHRTTLSGTVRSAVFRVIYNAHAMAMALLPFLCCSPRSHCFVMYSLCLGGRNHSAEYVCIWSFIYAFCSSYLVAVKVCVDARQHCRHGAFNCVWFCIAVTGSALMDYDMALNDVFVNSHW